MQEILSTEPGGNGKDRKKFENQRSKLTKKIKKGKGINLFFLLNGKALRIKRVRKKREGK